jgi:hypothetical protein
MILTTFSTLFHHRDFSYFMRLKWLVLLPCLLLLSQCTTVDPARKAAVKKLIVACNVGDEVTRFQLGLLAFGNKSLDPIKDKRVKAGVNQIIREQLQGKFPEVVVVNEEPPRVTRSLFDKDEDYKAWGANLARKYKADACLMLVGWYGYPYGAPSYMQAQGWVCGTRDLLRNCSAPC